MKRIRKTSKKSKRKIHVGSIEGGSIEVNTTPTRSADTTRIWWTTPRNAEMQPRSTAYSDVEITGTLTQSDIDNIDGHSRTEIVSIEIGNTVTGIGNQVFSNCNNLTSITIPDSVESIGENAFFCCMDLTGITIPDSVTSIGARAFDGCIGLTGVYISNLANWCAISFGSGGGNPLEFAQNLYLNGQKITTLTIPNGVTSIGACAFEYCNSLTSVTIPEGVTSIGPSAFSNCINVTSLTVASSVKNIGYMAFHWLSRLTNATFSGLTINEVQALKEDGNTFGWTENEEWIPKNNIQVTCSDGSFTTTNLIIQKVPIGGADPMFPEPLPWPENSTDSTLVDSTPPWQDDIPMH